MTPLVDRMAGAPISWGVCEVPGWGYQIGAERLLSREDVARVLDGSSVPLCLDTGHLFIGGSDPVELAREATARIAHTHLKDVDAGWAERVRSGETTYTSAVTAGMYRPLGRGHVDVAAIVDTLESSGYAGWYRLEQDTVLHSEPENVGPPADVRTSVAFRRGLAT